MEKKKKETIKKVLIGVGFGTGLCGLAAIPVVYAICRKHDSGIWAQFDSDKGPFRVYNNDVTKMVKEHSKFLDRLHPGRMVDMTFMAFDILNGSVEKPENENWKFSFSKDGNMMTPE